MDEKYEALKKIYDVIAEAKEWNTKNNGIGFSQYDSSSLAFSMIRKILRESGLDNDQEVMLRLLKENNNLSVLASEKLRDNKEFILKALDEGAAGLPGLSVCGFFIVFAFPAGYCYGILPGYGFPAGNP